jgi:hypothetical protein
MKAKDVPQEDSILEGHKRACYAVDESGHYQVVASRGWEVEKICNQVAVGDLRRALEDTRLRAIAGKVSALEYHMQRCQMDASMLASNARLWRWRVQRHLRPDIFARLSIELLQRYADVLRVSVEELRRIPTEPHWTEA